MVAVLWGQTAQHSKYHVNQVVIYVKIGFRDLLSMRLEQTIKQVWRVSKCRERRLKPARGLFQTTRSSEAA